MHKFYTTFLLLCILNTNKAFTQILTFEFSALAGDETTASSNSNDANLGSSTISRGAGLTASVNGGRFNSTDWALISIANAVTGNDYVEFTITPNSGYQFSVTSIVVKWQRSGTGNTQIALRSSIDGYASNLDAVKNVTDNTLTQTFTFTFTQSNSTSAVTYRLYSYAEATGGTGGPGDGSGNDIVVNGSVSSSSAPTVTIDNTGAPATGNIVYNTNDVVISGFQLTPSASVDFTAVNIATSGTATTSDLSNFELIYDADNSGTFNGGDAVVASVGTLSNPLAFSGFTQTFSAARRYLIIADVAAAATDGRTFTASISASSNVTSTGNESGTATGNTQTIQAPEISVEGNSTVISSGDNSPSATDHTAFGNVEVGQSLVRTFTIKNIGNQTLNLNASNPRVTISGSSQFTVTTQPSTATISGPSGSLTFDVTYTPTTYDLQTATISITNNDANGSENPYTFDVNGTGTSSSTSDIILSGMTYTTDITYTSFQAPASLTNTSGNVGVMGITIRDGGASSPDNDGLPTILTGITFSGITGTSMVRAAALFEGNTLISNNATINTGANTIAFSGFSHSCTDNSTRDLTLRISFLTTVTDNLQMSFSVTNANVTVASSATSSQMASFTTVNSSTTGDRNRIEVTATKLAFQQQPSTTTINATMSPAPTVRALDANNNLDLDYVTSISITSTGTMTGDPISSTPSSGVATFSSVVHTVAGTGYTLSASSTGLTSATSNAFNIVTFTYLSGDFRPKYGTDLSYNGDWEYYNGTSWGAVPDGKAPQNTSTTIGRVLIDQYVNGGGNATNSYNCDFIIMSGGEWELNENDNPPVAAEMIAAGKKLEVLNGGKLTVQGDFDVATTGNLIVRDGGEMEINQPSITNEHPMWDGVELFESGSTVTIKDWDFFGICNKSKFNEYFYCNKQ